MQPVPTTLAARAPAARPPSGTAKGGMPARSRGLPGLLLGLMLAIDAHGQTAASGTAAVPSATAYFITFKVMPGKNAAFEQAMGEMMAGVREKEPGNLYCDLLRLPEDPQTYVVMERYGDAQASKAHGESDYIKKLGDDLKNGLLDGPPQLQALVFVRSK